MCGYKMKRLLDFRLGLLGVSEMEVSVVTQHASGMCIYIWCDHHATEQLKCALFTVLTLFKMDIMM